MPKTTPIGGFFARGIVEQYVRGAESWEHTQNLLLDCGLDLTSPERDELVGLREIAVDGSGPLEDAVVEAALARVDQMIEERA